jgi:hypothetical protein
MITGHAGRPAKKRAFPKNLRPRPKCCDNAVGGPRARPRVIERNETRVTLTQVKRVSQMWYALVLLALTRTTLSRVGIAVKGGKHKHLIAPGHSASQDGVTCRRQLTGSARQQSKRLGWPSNRSGIEKRQGCRPA